MKKIFVSFLTGFFFLTLAGNLIGMTVGLKAGFNLSSLKVSPTMPDLPQFKNRSSFGGGIFISFDFGPVSIEPEILYAPYGTKFNMIIDDLPYRVQYQFDYLEGLLLLRWRAVRIGPVKPVIMAGPSFGFLTRAKGILTPAAGGTGESVDMKDMYKKSEIGLSLGAGIEAKVKKLKLSLEARYHLGLTNIAASSFEGNSIKNRAVSVLAGLSF
ncbi:MAG: PorT family protein [Candidatus Saccharicenans sp.]|nr:PorT family protein [Candidatus Saccharicenans sp.]